MSSMQEGSYAQYIRTVVNFYSGYIQIHDSAYWQEKVINNSLEYTADVKKLINRTPGITAFTPRLENYALASSNEITKGVMVIGILAVTENSITNLSKRISKGSYLANGDSGVVLGSELARYLKIKVGDTIVLLSQGYHGVSAAGKYPVRGLIKQPSPELDRTVVYMDIGMSQELFSAQNRLTSVVLMVKSEDDLLPVKQHLESVLGKRFDVMDWREMNSLLMKQIESDRASSAITKGILYMIIAFGIFGTIMMMTVERRKEFGVLIAVGMQKRLLVRVLLLETIMIGLVGSLTGILVSIPVNWYFTLHPIPFTGQAAETMMQMGFDPVMEFSMAPSVFYNQALTILAITLIIGCYPVMAVYRLKVNKALKM
jgi:ABC-type lipoprotein release transport system permease subunit